VSRGGNTEEKGRKEGVKKGGEEREEMGKEGEGCRREKEITH
jgi:hypothetical protein